jgi:hypothetical protein
MDVLQSAVKLRCEAKLQPQPVHPRVTPQCRLMAVCIFNFSRDVGNTVHKAY